MRPKPGGSHPASVEPPTRRRRVVRPLSSNIIECSHCARGSVWIELLPSEGRGQAFESLRARQQIKSITKLDFGLFMRRGRVHFPFGSRYGAEFLLLLGLAGTWKKSDRARFRGARPRSRLAEGQDRFWIPCSGFRLELRDLARSCAQRVTIENNPSRTGVVRRLALSDH